MIPKIDEKWFEDLCRQNLKPMVVTGWLKLWLEQHFSETNSLEDKDQTGPAQRFVWRPDENTGLVIENITRWAPRLTESRPAIIIKRNKWSRARAGIGNRWMNVTDPLGSAYYENLWQGSHSLFCIANDGAEAEILATEVFRELNQFSPIVRHVLNLLRFEVAEVGEPVLLEEARENFVVPVTVVYASSEVWKVFPAGDEEVLRQGLLDTSPPG